MNDDDLAAVEQSPCHRALHQRLMNGQIARRFRCPVVRERRGTCDDTSVDRKDKLLINKCLRLNLPTGRQNAWRRARFPGCSWLSESAGIAHSDDSLLTAPPATNFSRLPFSHERHSSPRVQADPIDAGLISPRGMPSRRPRQARPRVRPRRSGLATDARALDRDARRAAAIRVQR